MDAVTDSLSGAEASRGQQKVDGGQKIGGNCEKLISFFNNTLITRFLEQFVSPGLTIFPPDTL